MKNARFVCSLVWMLMLGFWSSRTNLVSAEVERAGADKSHLARLWAGVNEGLRFASMALAGDENQNVRKPTTVKLGLVGFGRTGTTSIVKALQLLGYTVWHDDTLAENSDLLGKLYGNEITMDEFVNTLGQRGFDTLFLFTDDFLQWLVDKDDVQVLLTKRDNGRKWAESWKAIASMVDHGQSRPFIWSQTVRDINLHFDLIYRHISTLGQPEKYKDLDTLEKAYDAHLVKVREMIPSNRLLEFNVKEGWGPLCEFLNKPVPAADTKFPHVNDRVVVKTLVGTFWLITWIWPLVPLGAMYMLWKIVQWAALRTTKSQEFVTEKKRN